MGDYSTSACGRHLHSRQRRSQLARRTFSTPAHLEPPKTAWTSPGTADAGSGIRAQFRRVYSERFFGTDRISILLKKKLLFLNAGSSTSRNWKASSGNSKRGMIARDELGEVDAVIFASGLNCWLDFADLRRNSVFQEWKHPIRDLPAHCHRNFRCHRLTWFEP